MRMRNPKDKDEVLNSCEFYYDKEVGFSNNNPVCLEIGMGKGDFLLGMALNNPNINYVGVEKYSSVLSVAIKKIREYDLPNLKVLNMDAALLGDIFKNCRKEEGNSIEIGRIRNTDGMPAGAGCRYCFRLSRRNHTLRL